MIPLPNSMYDETSEICFLSKDPQKKYKELLLEKNKVPGLTKVISLGKLRQKYHTIDSKKDLAASFDLFLCDSEILEMLPGTLGKAFFKNNRKNPVPVRMPWTNPKERLQKVIKCTPLRQPTGPCVGVKIGNCAMTEEQLVENAQAVIPAVLQRMDSHPIVSISVHAGDAPALPVWRLPRAEGELLDLKAHRSKGDGMSSAASDTTGQSETEDGTSELSGLETLSEPGTPASGTPVESLSELETANETNSEMDSDGEDENPVSKTDLPLMKGLKKGKRRKAEVVEEPVKEKAKAKGSDMPPPAAKKAKKTK